MLDHAVLYLWYRDGCAVTADHYARLVDIEGRHRVIPLDVSGRPGAIDLGKYAGEPRWEGPDAALYRWAASAAFVPARRYFVVEWDTLATMPLREWWGERCCDSAWAVVAAANPTGEWAWWEHVPRLPAPIRPHAAGFCPFGVQVLSLEALKALAEVEPAAGVFCELRQASYLRWLGVSPAVREPAGHGEAWCRDVRYTGGRGLWHPIKEMVACPST